MTDVEAAEERIKASRQQLFATVGEIQERLRPASLAQDALESATHGVASAVRKGTDAVRKRPLAVAAVAGSIGLVMARRWIGNVVRNHRLKGHETSHETGKAPVRSETKAAKGAQRAKKGPAK